MASVDSIAEYHEAKEQGWRCYRHTSSGEMLNSEIQYFFILTTKLAKSVNCAMVITLKLKIS